MVTEVKSTKRVQSTTATRDIALRDAAALDIATLATNIHTSALPVGKVTKVTPDLSLNNMATSRRDEVDVSLLRKKKKSAKDTDINEVQNAGAGLSDSGSLDGHVSKHDAQSAVQSDPVAKHLANLDGSSSEIVQLHRGADAPISNIFEGYSFEMMLELIGGSIVGGISSAISNAYLKTSGTTAPSAPLVNTVAGDNVISASEAANGVFLTGTNEAGATTTIAGHAVVQYTATNWYYLMGPSEIAAFGQGQVLFTAESTDKAGNKSITSKSVLIDTVAPVAATVNTVAGNDIVTAAERDASVTITGTNEVGATVTVNGNAATISGTAWSYTLTPTAINALGQGVKTLSVVSADAVGNTTTTNKQITVSTEPQVTIDTVAGDNVINASEQSTSVVVTGTNEAGATVTVNGHAAIVSGTTWSYTLTSAAISALSQGSQALTVVATDSQGITGTATQSITIDTLAPTTPPQIQLAPAATYWAVNPQATIHTSLGDIIVELNPTAAPITAANWLSYVDNGFYNNLIFHRVISNFMVQGGGFDVNLNQITPTYAAITLESNNGLSNTRGTIAMARTSVANSATDQFYINTVDNTFLDYSSTSNPGYAVFGHVVTGMSVVDAIAAVNTTTSNGMADVPVTPITINSVDQTLAGTAYSTGLVNLVGLESGAHWEYALDNGTSWISSTSSTLNISAADGAHTLAVRQADAAGNTSATSSINIILDRSGPVFSSPTTVSDLANHANAGQLIYTAAAADLGVGHVIYGLKAGSDAALSINTNSGAITLNTNADYAVQNAYDFTVVATDALGNQSEMHLNMAVLPI